MQRTDFPRVCIVSANPLCSTMANGIMMSSLFAGWPKDRLAQIYLPVIKSLPEFDVCADFRMIRPSGLASKVEPPAPSAVARGGRPGRGATSRRLIQAVQKIAPLHRWLKLSQEVWYAHSWIGAALARQLRAANPDVVYAVLGNYGLTKAVCLACERQGLRTFIHVTDDYIRNLYRDKPFSSRLQEASERWFRRMVDRAEGCAAISPQMADEFHARYGGEWQWFATLADGQAYDPAPKPDDGTVRFVFAGSLFRDRARTLALLARALKSLAEKSGIESRLVIHSFPEKLAAHRAVLEVPPITELAGYAPFEELPRVFSEADVLVHVESTDPYAKYSLSTKIGQYMMAGRCILALGSEEFGSTRFVREAGAGVCLDQTDPVQLEQALERFLRHREARLECARRGRECALEWFELRRGHERFRSWLSRGKRGQGVRVAPLTAAVAAPSPDRSAPVSS